MEPGLCGQSTKKATPKSFGGQLILQDPNHSNFTSTKIATLLSKSQRYHHLQNREGVLPSGWALQSKITRSRRNNFELSKRRNHEDPNRVQDQADPAATILRAHLAGALLQVHLTGALLQDHLEKDRPDAEYRIDADNLQIDIGLQEEAHRSINADPQGADQIQAHLNEDHQHIIPDPLDAGHLPNPLPVEEENHAKMTDINTDIIRLF